LYSVRVKGSQLPNANSTNSQNRAATAKARTMAGPRPTSIKKSATPAIMARPGSMMSGRKVCGTGKSATQNSIAPKSRIHPQAFKSRPICARTSEFAGCISRAPRDK
jgi:hypothetical protein